MQRINTNRIHVQNSDVGSTTDELTQTISEIRNEVTKIVKIIEELQKKLANMRE